MNMKNLASMIAVSSMANLQGINQPQLIERNIYDKTPTFSQYTPKGKVFGGTKMSKRQLRELIRYKKETAIPKMVMSEENINQYYKDKSSI